MSTEAFITTTLMLERLKDSRDTRAWGMFDQRFRGVILSTAIKLGLAEADAADAAQETILQALRDYQAGKYDRSKGRLSTWIVSIAHHRIVDALRKRRRDRDIAAGSRGGGRIDEDPSTGDVAAVFDQALERKIFEQAWEKIQAESKLARETLLAFELTALRQVPAAQVASRCGLSVEQVYVAKNRVSKRLQEMVEELSRAFRDGL